MCGRYAVGATGKEITRTLKAKEPATGKPVWDHPVYSLAPSSKAPVVEDVDQQRILTLARWGFTPAWVKPGGPRPINARAESAASSGMWRAALSSGRVLVPMSGYYEWLDLPEGKQPVFLRDPAQPLLAAAGLMTFSEDSVGKHTGTFAVLTQQASDAAGEVHERMPVFLPSSFWDDWLGDHKLDTDQRRHLLSAATAASSELTSQLEGHWVDKQVNNVRTADPRSPALIEPITHQ